MAEVQRLASLSFYPFLRFSWVPGSIHSKHQDVALIQAARTNFDLPQKWLSLSLCLSLSLSLSLSFSLPLSSPLLLVIVLVLAGQGHGGSGGSDSGGSVGLLLGALARPRPGSLGRALELYTSSQLNMLKRLLRAGLVLRARPEPASCRCPTHKSVYQLQHEA